MKLKEIISEMSLPIVKSEEQAVDLIKQAYNAAVVKKQPNMDLYGPLHSAMKFLQTTTAPEKYVRYVKMGKAAKSTMDKYRKGVAKQQVKFTTMQKRLD
jgi:hypothetical protein